MTATEQRALCTASLAARRAELDAQEQADRTAAANAVEEFLPSYRYAFWGEYDFDTILGRISNG